MLWLLGLLAIPMGIIPSQVMNYLTGILQPGSVNSGFSVIPVVIVFFLSIVGVAVLNVIQTIIKGIALESLVRTRSLKLFEHVLKAVPEFFRKNQTAKISNRIVDEIRKTESFLLQMRIGLPVSVIGLLAFGYVLFAGLDSETFIVGSMLPENFRQQGNWFLASLILVTSPLQAYFLLFDKKLQHVRMATAKADDDIADISYETVNSVREIRNNYSFAYAIYRMRQVFDRLRKVEIDITKIQALFTGIGPVLDGLIKVALLAVGARLCLGDLRIPVVNINVEAIEWKDYMGFSGIAIMVNTYVGQLKDYLFQWRMSKESFRRIKEFENAEQLFNKGDQTLSVKGSEDEITFKQLDFETDNGIKILNDLSLDIKPGEHIAFVGPSGCGKSTTLNLILREISKSSGELLFSDKNIEQCDFENLSHEIGFVQQKPVLLNTSIRNNILLGLRRNSSKTISDSESVIDVSRIENCNTIADLNKHIIKVVDKVALKQDLVRKALDNPLPGAYVNSFLIEKAELIHTQICEELANFSEPVIHNYCKDQFLSASTVLENIIFGRLLKKQDSEFSEDENPVESIISVLKETEIFNKLLWLGAQQFISDQNIAMQIRHHSPQLFDILTSYKIAGEDNVELSGEVAHLQAINTGSLQSLKPKLQNILVEMALSAPAGQLVPLLQTPDDFIDLLIRTRNELLDEAAFSGLSYVSFDSGLYVNGLSLREAFLGGQVKTEIRNAYAQVDKMISAVLEKHGLLDEVALMGLESPVGEEGRLLSGGQAMKVAIARTLLKNPSILLLDEATAALDEKSQARIVELIEKDFKDKTVIMISHRLSTIREFDRVVVFDRGQVVQQGSYNELVEQPGLFQDLVRQEKGEVPQTKSSATVTAGNQAGSDIHRAIALSPVFSSLQTEQIALLERMAQTAEVKKGDVLFNRGDDGNEFFIILKGEVEFFAPSEAGVEIVDTYGVGQSFGELALFGNVPRTLGAKAKTDLKLCVITRDDLLKLITINPDVSITFLENISKQVAAIRQDLY